MGQQQLLLIVLGVIIVGVAVVLGIQYFSVGAEEAAKDEVVSHSMTIAANAQQWFRKPVAMGGGGNTFAGFETHFADHLQQKLGNTTNASYTIGDGSAASIAITGTPLTSLGYDWTVTTTVTPDSIKTVIN